MYIHIFILLLSKYNKAKSNSSLSIIGIGLFKLLYENWGYDHIFTLLLHKRFCVLLYSNYVSQCAQQEKLFHQFYKLAISHKKAYIRYKKMVLTYLKSSIQCSLNSHTFCWMCPIGCDGSDQTEENPFLKLVSLFIKICVLCLIFRLTFNTEYNKTWTLLYLPI